jgi:hypothetical protein
MLDDRFSDDSEGFAASMIHPVTIRAVASGIIRQAVRCHHDSAFSAPLATILSASAEASLRTASFGSRFNRDTSDSQTPQ